MNQQNELMEYYNTQQESLPNIEASLPRLPDELEESIMILVQAAELLGIDDASFASYSSAITQLTTESLDLSRNLNRLKFVDEELEAHLAALKHEHSLVLKWKKSLQSETETTVGIERRRESLLKKAKEYHNELNEILAKMPDAPPVTISQLAKQQEKNKLREQQLKTKQAKIEAFKGLPLNLELARHELRNARKEQMKLIQLRERLLGRMADSVA